MTYDQEYDHFDSEAVDGDTVEVGEVTIIHTDDVSEVAVVSEAVDTHSFTHEVKIRAVYRIKPVLLGTDLSGSRISDGGGRGAEIREALYATYEEAVRAGARLLDLSDFDAFQVEKFHAQVDKPRAVHGGTIVLTDSLSQREFAMSMQAGAR